MRTIISEKRLRAMLEKKLLNEKTVSVDVSKDLTVALGGSFEQQCVYLHNKTLSIDGINPAFKSFGEFLASIEYMPRKGDATRDNEMASGFGIDYNNYPLGPREQDNNFVFSKKSAPLNNYVDLGGSKERLSNFANYCLAIQGGTQEFGSAGDVMEFVMSNLLASFYEGTVLNKTDTAQGQDIVLEDDDTYFEVKFTEKIKKGVKQVRTQSSEDEIDLDLYQFFYESAGESYTPPSKPQLKTGATPPTANPKKYFVLVTLGRSYLIRSDILANFLFTSKGLIPVNLDPNDFENINRIEELRLLVSQRIDIAEKIRDFISVENQEHMYTSLADPKDPLIDYEEGKGEKKGIFTPKIESDLYADGFIDFLNHNRDCRRLFLAFMFGTAMLTFRTQSISAELKPLSEEVAKARAHEAIQGYLSGPVSTELTERVASLLRSEDSQNLGQLQKLQRVRNRTDEQDPLIDFREDSTLLINDSSFFNYYLDLMPAFFTLFGVTFSKEEGYIMPATPQGGISQDTMTMSSRLSTMISTGGSITGVLADEKINLGVRIAFLCNLSYVPEIASSEELEASFRNGGVKKNFITPIKNNTTISGLPGSYKGNASNSKAILAAELMKNKALFLVVHEELITDKNKIDPVDIVNPGAYTGVLNRKTLLKLFNSYIKDVTSPLNDFLGARPFRNDIDLVIFKEIFKDSLTLFKSFSESFLYDNYLDGYDELKTDELESYDKDEFDPNLGVSDKNRAIYQDIENLERIIKSISGKGSKARKQKFRDEVEDFEDTMSRLSAQYEFDTDEFSDPPLPTANLPQPVGSYPFSDEVTPEQIEKGIRKLGPNWKYRKRTNDYRHSKTGEIVPANEIPLPIPDLRLRENLYNAILKDIMEAAIKKRKSVKRK